MLFITSKYGNTSPNTCDAIGAATPPPWCPPSPVGLYNVISITTSGSSIGATPTNDVTNLFVFTPSSDVPVFPPIEYPATCAFFPVPSATTVFIILNTFVAVSFDITLPFSCTSIFVTSFVLLFIICFTILGFINVPPFAIDDTAVIICNGVISNLCPNDIVASSTGPTFSSFKNIPEASPGKSTPVIFNSPNFSR